MKVWHINLVKRHFDNSASCNFKSLIVTSTTNRQHVNFTAFLVKSLDVILRIVRIEGVFLN